MGSTHSLPHSSRDGASTLSLASYSSSSRENEVWLNAKLERFLDDNYITEWTKRNDLFAWLEKERKKSSSSSSGTSMKDGGGSREHSEVYEQLQSLLGSNFVGVQSSRLSALVSEIFDQCELSPSKSNAAKRQLFIRRIHYAIQAMQKAMHAKANSQATAVAVVPATPSLLTPAVTSITTEQQEAELKKLPLPQQLSVRCLMAMLQSMQPTDDASSSSGLTALVPASSSSSTAPSSSTPVNPALVSFFLSHLLPILSDLMPLLASEDRGKLGVMEAVESFLMRVFNEQSLQRPSNTSADSASASSIVPSGPNVTLAQVTTSLLALALSRARLSSILSILHPIFLSHLAPSKPLDLLPCAPKPLLKRITLTEGPKLANYLKGKRGAASTSSGARVCGSLYSWGTSQSKALGFGNSTSTKKAPTVIPEFDSDTVTCVSAFQNHVLLVTSDSKVWGFGSNENYRLGLDEIGSKGTPTLLPFFSDKRVAQVCVGNEFSAVLTGDGHVYCFGDGQNMKLGNGTTVASKTPVLIQSLASSQKVTSIACGGFHTLAITATNELFTFGKNSRGQLGNGTSIDSSPVSIKAFNGLPLKQVSAGWEHSLVLTADGTCYSFGGGYENKPVTGHSADGADVKTPKAIASFSGMEVTVIACGWDHSLFLTSDGAAWACGDGSGGRLGCGDVSDQWQPKRIKGFTTPTEPTELKIVACAGGESHSAFIAIDGSVWSVGTDGTNAAAIKTVPTKLECPKPMRSITCGGKISLSISGLPAIAGAADEKEAESVDEPCAFFDTINVIAHPSLSIPAQVETCRSTKLTALMLLSQLDRLAAQQSYERDLNRAGPNTELLQAPFCIEVNQQTLRQLFDIVTSYTKSVAKQFNDVEERVRLGLPQLTRSWSGRSPALPSASTPADRRAARKAARAEQIAKEEAELAKSTEVHQSVTCDSCRMSPLTGARWKCNVCNDFDYCNSCRIKNPIINKHAKEHTFTRYSPGTSGYFNAMPVASALTALLAEEEKESKEVDVEDSPEEESCEWHDSYVLLAAFRLLKANFTRLLASQVPLESLGLAAPSSTSSVAIDALVSEADANEFTISKLQAYLLKFVDGDFGFTITASAPTDVPPALIKATSEESVTASSNVVLAPTNHAKELAEALRSEAVQFLRVGIEVFYSSQSAKESLVESLLDSQSQRSLFLAPALLGRLAEDNMVAAFVPAIIQPHISAKAIADKSKDKKDQVAAASASVPASNSNDHDSPVLVDAAGDGDADAEAEPEAEDEVEQSEIHVLPPNSEANQSSDFIASASALANELIKAEQQLQAAESENANANPQAPEEESGSSSAQEEDEEEEEEDGNEVSVPPAAPESEADSLPPFNCAICTFANEAGVHECQMCGSVRVSESASGGADDAFQQQLQQMQQAIQQQQAELLAEQLGAIENQQLLLAQQLSNAAAAAASAVAESASAAPASVSPEVSASISAAGAPASLISLISNLVVSPAPSNLSAEAPQIAGSGQSSASPAPLLADASIALQPASPIAQSDAAVDMSFSLSPNAASLPAVGNVVAISSTPPPASASPAAVAQPSPSTPIADAAINAAVSAADEAAAVAAMAAQEAEFKVKSKQLSSLLTRLVTATALAVRGQLTAAVTLPASQLDAPPSLPTNFDPRLQFLISLQKHTLSWAAACGDQLRTESEKPATNARSDWLALLHRNQTASMNVVRQYAELLLDAALELVDNASSLLTNKAAVSSSANDEINSSSASNGSCLPLHLVAILKQSLVGAALPSLLVAIGLLPTEMTTLSSALSDKYESLLKSIHPISSCLGELSAALQSQLPNERQAKREKKEQREKEKLRLREEKKKAKAEKKRLKDGGSTSAATPEKADAAEEKEEEKKEEDSSSTSTAVDKELLQQLHDSCTDHLSFVNEVERELSWLLSTVIETEFADADVTSAKAGAAVDVEVSSHAPPQPVFSTPDKSKSHGLDDSRLVTPFSGSGSIRGLNVVATSAELEWLSSDLLKLGLEDSSVPFDESDAFDPSSHSAEDDDLPPEPLELSRRLTPSSRSAHITADDVLKFTADLQENVSVAARLYDWMCHSLKNEMIGKPEVWLDRTARTAFAALLKHHGLLAEAISYGRLVVRKGTTLSTAFAPAPELTAAWREAQGIRLTCLRNAQEISQKRAVEKEAATSASALETDPSAASTQSPYEASCRPVLACAEFLLRISPSLESVSARSSAGTLSSFALLGTSAPRLNTGASKWSLLRMIFRVVHRIRFLKFQLALEGFEKQFLDRSAFKQTRRFLTSACDCQRLETLMENRSRKAVRRLHALRRLHSLLQRLDSPICRLELLSGLRRSLYHRHILDSIDGCGSMLISLVRKQFTRLMESVTNLIAIPDVNATLASGNSSSLRLAALGCFVFRLRKELSDHSLIAHVGIIPAVQSLLAKASHLHLSSTIATQAATSNQSISDVAKQLHSEYKENKKLLSAAWKVLRYLACELGIGIRASFASDNAASSDNLQLDQHSPYLESVLQVLYEELHRSLNAWVNGEGTSSALAAAAATASASNNILKEIPPFGQLPLSDGHIELVRSDTVLGLKPTVLGYSWPITNPNGYTIADEKKAAVAAAAAAPAASKPSLFGSAPAVPTPAPAATAVATTSNTKMDFTLSLWVFIAREAPSSSAVANAAAPSSTSNSNFQLIALRSLSNAGMLQLSPALLLNDVDSRLKVLVSTVAGSATPEFALTNTKLPVRKWVHVIISLSDKNLSIYLNGELDSTKPLTSGVKAISTIASSASDELHVGRVRSRLTSQFPQGFDGQVGSVAFWHRSLPAANVKDIYQSGHPRISFHLSYANRIVSLLTSLDGMPIFLTSKWMKLFMWILQHGEVSSKVRMLRLMRKLLPNLAPKKAQYLAQLGDGESNAFSLNSPSPSSMQAASTAADGNGSASTSSQLHVSSHSLASLSSSDDLNGNGETIVQYLIDLISMHTLPCEAALALRQKWNRLIEFPVLRRHRATPSTHMNAATSVEVPNTVDSSIPSSLAVSATPASSSSVTSSADEEADATVAAEAIMLVRHLMNIPARNQSDDGSDSAVASTSALPSSSPKLSPSLSPASQLPHNSPSFWPVLFSSVVTNLLKDLSQALADRRQGQSPAPATNEVSVKSEGIIGSAFFPPAAEVSLIDATAAASTTTSATSPSNSSVALLMSSLTRGVSVLDVLGGHMPLLRLGAAIRVKSNSSIPSAHHHQLGHIIGFEFNRASVEIALQPNDVGNCSSSSGSDDAASSSASSAESASSASVGDASSPLPMPITSTCDINWLSAVEEIPVNVTMATTFVNDFMPAFTMLVAEYEKQMKETIHDNDQSNQQQAASQISPVNRSAATCNPSTDISSTLSSTSVVSVSLVPLVGSRLLKVVSRLLRDSNGVRNLLSNSQFQLNQLVSISSMPIMIDFNNGASDNNVDSMEQLRTKLWNAIRSVTEEQLTRVGAPSAVASPAAQVKTADESKKENNVPSSSSPAPAAIAAAASSSSVDVNPDHESKINDLVALGFDRILCRKALERTKWNSANAADFLLTNLDQLEREKREEEEQALRAVAAAAAAASVSATVAADSSSVSSNASSSSVSTASKNPLDLLMRGITRPESNAIVEYSGSKDTCEEWFEVDYFATDSAVGELQQSFASLGVSAVSSSTGFGLSLDSGIASAASNSFLSSLGAGWGNSNAVLPTNKVSATRSPASDPSMSSTAALQIALAAVAAASKINGPLSLATANSVSSHLTTLQSALNRVDSALSVLYARQTVLAIVKNWPQRDSIVKPISNSSVLGPVDVVSRFFKLVAFRQSVSRLEEPSQEMQALERLLQTDEQLRQCLLEEAIRHMLVAATPAYASVAWGRRRLEESDALSLTSPRVEYAEWLLRCLLRITNRSLSAMTTAVSTSNESLTAAQPLLHVDTVTQLCRCLNSSNLCLREKLAKLLNGVLHLIVEVNRNEASTNPTAARILPLQPYVSLFPTAKLDQMLGVRLKKEEGKLLSSSYVAAMLDLRCTVSSMQTARESGAANDMAIMLNQAAVMQVEQVTSHSVELSWQLPSMTSIASSENKPNELHYVLEMDVSSNGSNATTSPVWQCVYVGPAVVWSQEGLSEHSTYLFRVCAFDPSSPDHRSAYSTVCSAQTAAGLQFSSSSAKEAGVTLTADGLSATFQTSASRWRTVLANRSFSSGTHSWLVKFDKVSNSSLFVGVAKPNTNKQSYVGSDMFSWSVYAKEGKRFYQNNRLPDKAAVAGSLVAWKNEAMVSGDILKLTLDCDAGLLTVQRNGHELGVAFDFLPKGEALYPAVSFNTNADKVTITQCSNSASSAAIKESKLKAATEPSAVTKPAADAAASPSQDDSVKSWLNKTLNRMTLCSQFLDCLDRRSPFPAFLSLIIYSRAIQFLHQPIRKLELSDGNCIDVDVSESACATVGIKPLARVNTRKGYGVVVGIEVSGRKHRREMAIQLSNRCSFGLDEEQSRQSKRLAEEKEQADKNKQLKLAATEHLDLRWSELLSSDPTNADGFTVDAAIIHAASIIQKESMSSSSSVASSFSPSSATSSSPTSYDCAVLHPAACILLPIGSGELPVDGLATPQKPHQTIAKKLASLFSAEAAAAASPAVHPPTVASSSVPIAPFVSARLSFSTPKHDSIWIQLDGVDDPIAVHPNDIIRSIDANTEEEEKKEREEKEEHRSSTNESKQDSSSSSSHQGLGSATPLTLDRFYVLLTPPSNLSAADSELVSYVNELVDQLRCQPGALLYSDFERLPPNPQLYPALTTLNVESLAVRFCALRTFNDYAASVLMDVDRHSPDSHSSSRVSASLGQRLSIHRDLMFSRLKLKFWNQLIEQTATFTKPSDDPYELAPGIRTITLNRHKAAKVKQMGSIETRLAYSILGQTKKEIGHWQPSELRRHYTKIDDGGQIRTFVVKFTGEGVRDNGGVYSELLSCIFVDLQSEPSFLPFFIRTPNARAGVGHHQDCWMPNPAQTSNTSLDYYRFIGQMMGVAIRGKVQVNFNMSPLFWKAMVGQPLTRRDLDSIDLNLSQTFEAMESYAKTISEDSAEAREFGVQFGIEHFTCVLSDGTSVVELVEGGAAKPVTLSNYREWIDACSKRRLHETAQQVKALRLGLGSIIPTQLFTFLTADELQRIVCGVNDWPISSLQAITKYEGKINSEVSYIRYFWEVLAEMSPSEKAQFMRFVFARERLPARPAELGIKFKLQEKPWTAADGDPNQYFPTAHTCFFACALPPYSSKSALKEKLYYAMRTCVSMDGDLVLKNSELYNEQDDDLQVK